MKNRKMGSLRGHPDSHVTVYGVSQHWLYGLKRLGGFIEDIKPYQTQFSLETQFSRETHLSQETHFSQETQLSQEPPF